MYKKQMKSCKSKSLYHLFNISVEDFHNFWSKFNVNFGQVDKRRCDSGMFQATVNKLGRRDASLRQKPVRLPGNVYMLAFTLMLLGSQTNHFPQRGIGEVRFTCFSWPVNHNWGTSAVRDVFVVQRWRGNFIQPWQAQNFEANRGDVDLNYYRFHKTLGNKPLKSKLKKKQNTPVDRVPHEKS